MKKRRMKEWKKRREGRGSALGISAAIAVFGDSAIGGELFLGDVLGAGHVKGLLGRTFILLYTRWRRESSLQVGLKVRKSEKGEKAEHRF
ncbi:MAG: hypothetical protein ACYCYF_13945 [Anaerolineae bacterium]